MDFVRIVTAPIPLTLKSDIKDAFKKVVEIWKDHCHTVNRRLSGIVLLGQRDLKRDQILAVSYSHPPESVEIRKFIPRSPDIFSVFAYETSFWLDDYTVEFRPCVLDNNRHPHVPFPYRFVLEKTDKNQSESGKNQWNLSLYVMNNNKADCVWLQKISFSRLLRWFTEIDEQCTINTTSHKLISAEDYARLYREIKNKWGQKIVADWTERTDPQKFVYEDCAIAAYLIAYWQQKGNSPRMFCDVGCGNGLLVHLLQLMKVNGYGIDLRKRRIWDDFSGTDLRERALNPENDAITDADFLIGNHTDELTPWIPIMAARSRSSFFLLPCCPFDFYGRFQKKCGMAAGSVYSSYIPFIRDICLRLGYMVEEDRLKIPSTKRHCFLCTVPVNGLVDNVDEMIRNILSSSKLTNFVSREKFEKVRNCSQLPWEFRRMLTMKIFKHLLGQKSDDFMGCWRQGGSCRLDEIADLLNSEEKAQLRDSDGGLQTFLKNQHQIFKVIGGIVSIRKWSEEGRRKVSEGKQKTSDCWFFKNHPDGCPLASEDCSYKH